MFGIYANDGSMRVTMAGSDSLASTEVTDRSGTITSGGAAQTLSAANTGRRGFFIQNVSTGDLWIRDGGTAAAAQPSIWIPAGAFFEYSNGVPTTALSIFGATTGQAFTAREW